MAEIVFEVFDGSLPYTGATGGAELPALTSFGSELPDYGIAILPMLEAIGVGSNFVHVSGLGIAELPAPTTFGLEQPGGYGVADLPLFETLGVPEVGLPAPQDGYGEVALYLESSGVGYSHRVGTGVAELPALSALGFEAAGGWGVAMLPALSAAGTETFPNRLIAIQSPGYVYAYFSLPLPPEEIVEAVEIEDIQRTHLQGFAFTGFAPSAAASSVHAANPVEAIVPAATATSIAHMFAYAAESADMEAIANVAWNIICTEGVVFEDIVSFNKRSVISLVEAMEATAIAESRQDAIILLAEIVALDAIATRGWDETHVEAVDMVDDVIALRTAIEQAIEAVVLEDDAFAGMRFTMALTEGVVMADEATSTARFYELLTEGFVTTAVLAINGERYVAWVVNTEGGAASMYDNFAFNSLAPFTIGGVERYFGAMVDGVYEIDGDDDAGEKIVASVRSGLTNFGSPYQKSMLPGYLFHTRTGELVIKIIATSPEGVKESHWYKLEGRVANAMREDKFVPDKGIESVWWQWEVTNVNGCDFEIDMTKFVPMMLNRSV